MWIGTICCSGACSSAQVSADAAPLPTPFATDSDSQGGTLLLLLLLLRRGNGSGSGSERKGFPRVHVGAECDERPNHFQLHLLVLSVREREQRPVTLLV
jgi:hypothetical protein